MRNYGKAFLWAPRMKYQEAPDVLDAIDAVTACAHCLNAHTGAITAKATRPTPAPWIDPPAPQQAPPQADGEGPES
jgi:hypothetical protein